MFADFRSADLAAAIDADVCIIGAGAAGITLARELAGSRLQVCVLESGGFELDVDTQDLYRGRNVGVPSYDLDSARLRYFGGTTNHWLGWCTELNEVDFRRRDWIPHSGWPIAHGDVAPFYRRARDLLGLDHASFEEIRERLRLASIPLDARKLVARYWQINDPPMRFGQAHRAELEQARNVHVWLHANAVELAAGDGAAHLDHVVVKNLESKSARVRARVYVLACGGVENARLLLASNRVAAAGLGNRHDLVGRFFMDHFQPHFADVLGDDPHRLLDAYDWQWEGNRMYLTALCMSEARQAEERVANTVAYLEGVAQRDSGILALDEIAGGLGRGEIVDDLADKLGRILRDLDGTAQQAWRRVVLGRDDSVALRKLRVVAFGDQVPNPDSRVRLSAERDALGMPRIDLDWRLTDLDRRGMSALGRTLGAELGRLGLGRLRLKDWLLDETADWTAHLTAGYHHIGTTRMADDAQHGVVDRDCRVHGIDNLYVAGSSVFPTAGYANPTLTIVALTLRLAEHLKERSRTTSRAAVR